MVTVACAQRDYHGIYWLYLYSPEKPPSRSLNDVIQCLNLAFKSKGSIDYFQIHVVAFKKSAYSAANLGAESLY